MRLQILASGLLACVSAAPALAQRSGESAIREATDAFGASIGIESVGLYNASDVRGFNPIQSGNARINGLYFDQQSGLTARLQRDSTIRVGLSSQGYPFPAPTGVVDYRLRLPGGDATLSTVGILGPFGGQSLEIDGGLPLAGNELSLGGGIVVRNDNLYTGANRRLLGRGLITVWRPSDSAELVAFWSRLDNYDNEASPTLQLGSSALPSPIKRSLFYGQDWADLRSYDENYGALGRLSFGSLWTLRAGAFSSASDRRTGFVDLFTAVQPDGFARHFIVASPRQLSRSRSGEIRLSRTVMEAERQHVLHLVARGRDKHVLYGGSDVFDLGEAMIGVPAPVARPAFEFTAQSRDQIWQVTGGIAYELRWRGVGELTLGVQRTDYRKTIRRPAETPASTEDNPWLYNGSIALNLTDRLALYAGYTRGLEESGAAPDNAANRGQALPAIRTRQSDAGLRWAITPRLRLVAGVFDVRKPYFNLNVANQFTLLGEQSHRGLEVSLTGALTPRLQIVAGAVLLRPRVRGEAVDLGRIGERPVGQPGRIIRVNLEYQLPFISNLSIDAAVSATGARAANLANTLETPAVALFDLGARYRGRIGSLPISARILASNVTNRFAWRVSPSGIMDYVEGRRALMQLSIDY